MRAAMFAAVMLVTLGGCVDADGNPIEFVPPAEPVQAAPPPGPEAEVPEEVAEPEARAAPFIDAIATARFTAPIPVLLDSISDEGIQIDLIADADGIACVPSTSLDLMRAPAGYRVDRTWLECSLSADNVTFTSAAGRADETLPLMLQVPVDHFNWTAELGRVLVNNDGEHDQVMLADERSLLAAPEVSVQAPYRFYDVCDSRHDTPEHPAGVETLNYLVTAERGLPMWSMDLGRHRLVSIDTLGNVTQLGSELHVVGSWNESLLDVSVTIDFEADEGSSPLIVIPSTECGPFSSHRDTDYVDVRGFADGIAAGWGAEAWANTRVEIFLEEPI